MNEALYVGSWFLSACLPARGGALALTSARRVLGAGPRSRSASPRPQRQHQRTALQRTPSSSGSSGSSGRASPSPAASAYLAGASPWRNCRSRLATLVARVCSRGPGRRRRRADPAHARADAHGRGFRGNGLSRWRCRARGDRRVGARRARPGRVDAGPQRARGLSSRSGEGSRLSCAAADGAGCCGPARGGFEAGADDYLVKPFASGGARRPDSGPPAPRQGAGRGARVWRSRPSMCPPGSARRGGREMTLSGREAALLELPHAQLAAGG